MRWFIAAILATAGAIAWYALEAAGGLRWPGGSSLVGLTYGIVAAGIILFECLLGLRRTSFFRTSRWLGSAKFWMKAHIWLGLLAVPLVLMHTGFHWGGWLSTLVAGAFALVTASGIFGWYMQNLIPRWLIEAVPEETIHSQIDAVAAQLCADARRAVGLHAPLADGHELSFKDSRRTGKLIMAGAPRRVGTMVERTPRPKQEATQELAIPQLLRDAVEQDIEPYLLTGKSPDRGLHTTHRGVWYFEEIRRRINDRELQTVVSTLAQLCERRRQMNTQQVLHFWLHSWLSLHLPLAMMLLILLAAHVWFALRYS
ncbi:hypothetical protein [Anatilimnocola floriformis]|uniref:hypothetical protein n=1 Tax=Anatilimnocola floriformis TaxID=2948575 RepID=UPI0020C5796D|nr:hypothetical protein [Anatilimnocola floriformis]